MWCDELHPQLLVKGTLMIKDASSLVPFNYSYFIYVLIALQNWLRYRLYTPFLFSPNLWIVFCKYKACFQKIGGKDLVQEQQMGKAWDLEKGKYEEQIKGRVRLEKEEYNKEGETMDYKLTYFFQLAINFLLCNLCTSRMKGS